jgi:excisionase family DNA binding protein
MSPIEGGIVVKHLLSVKETAIHIGLAEITVRKMISAKRIPHKKLGRRVLIDPDELDTWINEHSIAAIA